MLKDKIQALIKQKQRLFRSKFFKEELDEIEIFCSNFPTSSFSEQCFNFLHNNKQRPYCKECNIKHTVFLRISTGYREFCSCQCKNKYVYANTMTKDKISKSAIRNSENLSKSERTKQQNKRLKTLEARGKITPLHLKSLIEIYRRLVWRITNLQSIQHLPNLELRGRTEIDGAFQLDHRYSIVQGFLDNIPPYIIGNLCNLEMLPAKMNSSKKQKCSISLTELFLNFDRNCH